MTTLVRLDLGYDTPAAYETYGKDIWDLVERKFGELGTTEFGPFRSSRSYLPTHFVIIEVPYDVSLYDLRRVVLGDGVWTEFTVVDDDH